MSFSSWRTASHPYLIALGYRDRQRPPSSRVPGSPTLKVSTDSAGETHTRLTTNGPVGRYARSATSKSGTTVHCIAINDVPVTGSGTSFSIDGSLGE
jgi:hypothetical protein